jgi:CRP-like cAMP-binding protein
MSKTVPIDAHLATLATCRLFAGIDAGNLEAMLACLGASHRSYARGEFIYRAGDAAHSVGVVLSGAVHVVQEDYWGNRSLVAYVEPGAPFAEAFASAEVAAMPVSVVAADKSEVLLLDYSRIITTCSSACNFHARLVRNMMGILARKNVQLTRKIEHVTQRSTREKVLSYLSGRALAAGRAGFDIPLNRQELADYLAVDRSALSAELSRMQAEGLIRYSRNHFELL